MEAVRTTAEITARKERMGRICAWEGAALLILGCLPVREREEARENLVAREPGA